MELEGIMLSKISLTKEDKCCYVITYVWTQREKRKVKQVKEESKEATDLNVAYQ